MTFIICPNLAVDRVLQVAELAPGAVMRCRSLRQQAGGKGANVARALLALRGDGRAPAGGSAPNDAGGAPNDAGGAPTSAGGVPRAAVLLAGFAAGHGGRLIAALAADEGIAVKPVACAGEARVSTVILTDAGTPTRLFEFGPEIAAADERALLEIVAGRTAAPGEWAVVDGAAPPGASAGFYGALVRALRGGGYRVLVDAEGRQLGGALRERPDLVKVNLAEATSVPGGTRAGGGAPDDAGEPPDDPSAAGHDACRRLVDAGGAGAVVTLGAAGAVAIVGGVTRRVVTSPVTAVNPVGSGDCFAAGLVSALEHGENVDAALAAAAGTGAANAAHPITGHFDVALARDLAGRAAVETLLVRPGRAPAGR